MESIEKEPFPREGLREFKQEIAALKEAEKRERKTAHFEGMDTEELTEKDKAIWEQCKTGALSREEIREYMNEVFKEGNTSQKLFYGYVANEQNKKWQREEVEAWEKAQQK